MYKAPMQEEGLLRKRFKHLRSHGEWMFFEDDLLEHVRKIMPPGASPITFGSQYETAEIYPFAIGL